MDIELRGINKRFDNVRANNEINLKFNGGKIVGILGENGAGKSTLMKILSGFQKADAGDILINGKLVQFNNPKDAISHGIGMLQQDPVDVDTFTALESFIYGTQSSFIPNRRKAKKLLQNLTHRFGFEFDPETYIAEFTIAQRQQLEIVRLLTIDVQTIILDEPTTGISANQKETLFRALRKISEIEGALVLLVSHKLVDIISLCDEVYVLRAGRVVGARDMPATPEELVNMMFGAEFEAQIQAELDLSHSQKILRAENIKIKGQANRIALEKLSINVRESEVVGFAGLDGSGQELVLRAFVGLQQTLQGQVWEGKKNMTNKSYHAFLREGVTFCAAGRTEEGLIAGLTLTEHMALVREKDVFINWQRAQRYMDEQIEHYNVRGHSGNRIEELSGGNQQRVVMTLLPETPNALVMESPTRGLDVDSTLWIWRKLLDRRKKGTCIVFSSADIEELVTYSDRIFVFSAGHVVEIENPQQTGTDELGRLIGGHY